MSKPKSYCWLKPETKKALKIKALDLNKDMLDLDPEDLVFSKKKRSIRF
jgi:hypothetical protein